MIIVRAFPLWFSLYRQNVDSFLIVGEILRFLVWKQKQQQQKQQQQQQKQQ